MDHRLLAQWKQTRRTYFEQLSKKRKHMPKTLHIAYMRPQFCLQIGRNRKVDRRSDCCTAKLQIGLRRVETECVCIIARDARVYSGVVE